MKQNNYLAASVACGVLFTACTASDAELGDCDTVTTTYQIDQAKLPRNHFQAVLAARDFNGDHKTDNALGVATVAMVQLASEFEPAPYTEAYLQASPWLLQITECSQAATGSQNSSRTGSNANVTMQHNGVRETAVAVRRGAQYTIAADQAMLPLTWLMDSVGSNDFATTPGWIATHRAELVINVQGTQFSGRFTALVESAEARSLMLEPLVAFLNQPERSHLLRFALDTNGDGTISRDELQHHGSFTELTAPDILDEATGALSWTSVGFEIAGTQRARE
jgi:hypothetical protein